MGLLRILFVIGFGVPVVLSVVIGRCRLCTEFVGSRRDVG